MTDVLEKQAALTTPAREVFAALLRKKFHYTLPKAVDGLFSVHCLKFAQDENGIDYRKPVKGLMAYLLEGNGDMAAIVENIRQKSLEGFVGIPEYYYALYGYGEDGALYRLACFQGGKEMEAA